MERTLYRQYRKKPVVIEAVLWDGSNVDEVLDLAQTRASLIRTTDSRLLIETLEGTMRADRGDYVIRGVKGEIYPCKPGIFAVTYDRVAQPEVEGAAV